MPIRQVATLLLLGRSMGLVGRIRSDHVWPDRGDRRAFGRERLDAFLALKKKLDPEGVLQSDLTRRVLGR